MATISYQNGATARRTKLGYLREGPVVEPVVLFLLFITSGALCNVNLTTFRRPRCYCQALLRHWATCRELRSNSRLRWMEIPDGGRPDDETAADPKPSTLKLEACTPNRNLKPQTQNKVVAAPVPTWDVTVWGNRSRRELNSSEREGGQTSTRRRRTRWWQT